MAPKRNPQRDRPNPKPNPKGKQRAEPQSHDDAGDQAGSSSRPSGSSHNFPPPGRQKPKKRREEESDGALSSDDSLVRDMGGPDPRKGLVDHFINMPRATTTVDPGENTLGVGAGPSATDASPLPSPAFRLRDDFSSSASSLLQPPTRDDNSSSASSRGSKRRREASPQPPRRQNRPEARMRRESPPRRPAAPEQQIHMLQQQIRHHQDEIQTLRTQASQEYHVGFTHGRSRGFEEAMSMSLGGGPSANPGDPSNRERREPREPRDPRNRREDWERRGHRETRDPDEAEAEDLRHAVRESRREAPPPRPAGNPGAGPSRNPSHSVSRQASSSRLQAPVVPVTNAPPEYHDYEVAVIRRNGINIPDPKKVKLEGFACIPLPAEYSMPYPGIAIVRGPAAPPNPEDATSYVELWAGFANGRVVPDGFRRLFQAIGTALDPSDARSAMLGYSLVRQIARTHVGTFDRNAIAAFMVTLAAFERTVNLSGGRNSLWGMLLDREPSRSFNNWGELRGFMNPETYPHQDFGLRFVPPADASQPWEIYTRWRRDDFMRLLLAARPTLMALRQILAYADIFIRTRPAAQPLPGIVLPNEPQDRMYTASFILGPQTPEAFIVETTSTTVEPSGNMEVDTGPSQPADEPAPPA
jgi:hypothetical protein